MTTEFTRRFSKHLRDLMQEAGVTQNKVADRLGKRQSFVSEHTNGFRAPDTDLIDAVARLSGFTSRELVAEIVNRMRVDDQVAIEPVADDLAKKRTQRPRKVNLPVEEAARGDD